MIEDSEPMVVTGVGPPGWLSKKKLHFQHNLTVHLSLILSPLQDLIGVISASRARRTPTPSSGG